MSPFLLKFSIFLLFLVSQIACEEQKIKEEIPPDIRTKTPPVSEKNVAAGENHLSAQIYALIEHYKQEDPIGLPSGITAVPDPMEVPDIKKSLSLATLHMKDTLGYGLSKFRIKYIKTDLKELKVMAGLQLDTMTMKGNYTLSSLFSRSQGPFTIIIMDVFIEGNATLAVERDGKIRTQDILMDVNFADMSMDFQNLGFMGSIFQGIVNSASNFFFDTMKPYILNEAYTKIRTEIDTNLQNVIGDISLPNSISPLDMAIAEARKKVRNMGYDPFKVRPYNHTVGMFSLKSSNTWLTGISSFYRVGNISITLENNTVIIGMQVGTQELKGFTQWEMNFGGGMVSRAGHVKFSVQHVKVSYEVSQALDLRKRPKIRDLQLEVGNIQLRCDGSGTLDYIVELLVNIMPNLLRYQIADAIENPTKARIQEMMNKVDFEKVIKEKIQEFEKDGFNMKFDFDI